MLPKLPNFLIHVGCPLSDVTTVTVNVHDINDNPPMFARSNFNGRK